MRTRLVIVARSSLTLVAVVASVAALEPRCRAQEAPEQPNSQVSAASSSSPEQLAEERELIRLLADTLEQVRANYVDSQVSERELIEAAIHGMIAQARSVFRLHRAAGSGSVSQRCGTRVRRDWRSGVGTGRPDADRQPPLRHAGLARDCGLGTGSSRSGKPAPGDSRSTMRLS